MLHSTFLIYKNMKDLAGSKKINDTSAINQQNMYWKARQKCESIIIK